MIPIDVQDDNAAIGSDIGILHDIHVKTKNLAVYQRGIESLKKGLDQVIKLPVEFLDSGTVEEITFSLSSYFAKVLPGQLSLREDLLSLLELFEQVTRAPSFRLKLAKVSTNMCSRFHADNNQLRMLCTYYGPGTLWLPNHAVDRKAYLTGKGNQNILLDESLVKQVYTGDVVILKGALYPGATPILHRSPNIQENCEERILLSIDVNASLPFPK